jgi:hypothetical protein
VTARRQFYASIAALVLGSLACFLAASFESSQEGQMLGSDAAEAAEQAAFVLELYAIGLLNLLASIVFVPRPSRLTWWLLVAIQVAVFVVAAEGVLTDLGWFYFSGLPLFTLLTLLALHEAHTRLQLALLGLSAIPAVAMLGVWAHLAAAQPPSISIASHPTPLPSGLALTCTNRYRSEQTMGPLADGTHVHFLCQNGKVTAWWIDHNSGTETAPPH